MQSGWLQSLSEKFPPGSAASVFFALAVIAAATLCRIALGWFDVTIPYATYFPAVMLVALVSGPRIGAAASVLSAVVVWWAFFPPEYKIAWPTRPEWGNIALFLASSGMIVWVAHLYRLAIARLDENERQRSLLMAELEHRGKNTYAVVESIVRSSLEDAPERADTIAERIRAVSSTNDIINRSPEHRSDLRAIFDKEFAPYGETRLRASGHALELGADTARAIGLVVHEMVTNAVKYGALSAEGGHVAVRWHVEGRNVQLEWREQGGPPAKAPDRYGFGSKLVTRTMRALQGSATPDFRPEGLVCQFTFALG